jgi:hypothetical protein
VPTADVAQLSLIRDIVQQQPEAVSSYEQLMQALQARTTNGHQ